MSLLPPVALPAARGYPRPTSHSYLTRGERDHLARRDYQKAFERLRREEAARNKAKAEHKRHKKEEKSKAKARAKARAKAEGSKLGLKKTKNQRLKTFMKVKVLRCHP